MSRLITRRDWLSAVSASSLAMACGDAWGRPAAPPPVAAVVTTYGVNSHADVLVGKILEGFRQDGGAGPNLRLASLYVDQVSKGDLSRDLARRHGFRISETIDDAITLGTDRVQVAGVLSVGEHGNYPTTPKTKQKQYPRRRFFDAIADTFERTGGRAPVFNDKHLAYRWADAKHIYDRARRMKIPFMAGSSLPVAWRKPPLALPLDCELEEALVIGYGGLEAYGFHALETLQCMIERRRGGESGVASVQTLQGKRIHEGRKESLWSERLLKAALDVLPSKYSADWPQRLSERAAFYHLRHRDGLKSTVAMANGVARHFAFAAKIRGRDEPVATWFWLEETKPFGHFAYLLQAIEHMVLTGKPAYPVERTLLTTGVLDEVMQSLAAEGEPRRTPQLEIAYKPVDWPFARQQPAARQPAARQPAARQPVDS